MPVRAGRRFALSIRIFFKASALKSGLTASVRAAIPATTGPLFDVPSASDHGHGQDVVVGKTDRIRRILGQVDVQPGISRARDEQDIFPAGVFNGRFKLGQRFGGGIADETAPIDDPGAVIRGVADGLGRPDAYFTAISPCKLKPLKP